MRKLSRSERRRFRKKRNGEQKNENISETNIKKNSFLFQKISWDKVLYAFLLFLVLCYLFDNFPNFFEVDKIATFNLILLVVSLGFIFFFRKVSTLGIFFLALFIGYHHFVIKVPDINKNIQKFFTSNASYEQKMEEAHGWPMFYFKAGKEVMPEDAIYMYPPQASWPTAGNGAILRYFFTPRKKIPENYHWVTEQKRITHVLKLAKAKHRDNNWPLFYVPVKTYYRAYKTNQLINIKKIRFQNNTITDIKPLYSGSDVLESKYMYDENGGHLYTKLNYKVNGEYWGANIDTMLQEGDRPEIQISANCKYCVTQFAEVLFQNGEKVIFESKINTKGAKTDKKTSKKIPGEPETLSIENLYNRARSFAKAYNIPTETIRVTSVGLNVGKFLPHLGDQLGFIEIEHGDRSPEELGSIPYRDARWYFAMGYYFKNKGDQDSALVYFMKAYTIDMGYIDPLIELAEIYTEKKEYNLAIAILEKAVQTYNPPFAWVLYSMGNVARLQGDLEQAIIYYKQAGNRINPNYELQVNDFMARVKKNNSNNIIPFPKYDGFVSLALGETYEKLGNIEEAKKYYTFIAWNLWYSYDSAKAWDRLRDIAPEILKIMPIP